MQEIEGNVNEFIYLYLTDWQRNMIRDFVGKDCDRLEVPKKDRVVPLYGVVTPAAPETQKMYLTDFQIKQIMDELGIPCDFIDLTQIITYLKCGTPA